MEEGEAFTFLYCAETGETQITGQLAKDVTTEVALMMAATRMLTVTIMQMPKDKQDAVLAELCRQAKAMAKDSESGAIEADA